MADEKKPNTDYSKISSVWGAPLGENEAWQYARAELARKLDEAETKPFGQFFESKSAKNGGDFSAQVLSAILLTSVGNINAKYEKAKLKALEAGTFANKQAFIEGFIMDNLCPTLAEERAKREAKLAEERAERLALASSVTRALESVTDSWDDAGLTPNADLVRKACKRKLERDEATFAKAFSVELVLEVLEDDDEKASLLTELGLDIEADGLPAIDEHGNLLPDEEDEVTEEVTDEADEAEDVTPEVNVD